MQSRLTNYFVVFEVIFLFLYITCQMSTSIDLFCPNNSGFAPTRRKTIRVRLSFEI